MGRLSKLQRYIILQCYSSKNSTRFKEDFYSYYPGEELKDNRLGVQAGIQKSIENLVAKDLAAAYGHRPVKKFYVNKIKLTAKGRKLAKELIKKRQSKLPIK